MNRLLNIKARAPSYNNKPSQGYDSSTRTLLKTTNAHARLGVSFVASVIRVLLLSYFKMVRKTIGPIYPKRSILSAKVAKNLQSRISLPQKNAKSITFYVIFTVQGVEIEDFCVILQRVS